MMTGMILRTCLELGGVRHRNREVPEGTHRSPKHVKATWIPRVDTKCNDRVAAGVDGEEHLSQGSALTRRPKSNRRTPSPTVTEPWDIRLSTVLGTPIALVAIEPWPPVEARTGLLSFPFEPTRSEMIELPLGSLSRK